MAGEGGLRGFPNRSALPLKVLSDAGYGFLLQNDARPVSAESNCQIARLFRCFPAARGIYCLRISCAKCCMDEAESGGLNHQPWGVRRELRITA
jgi:hypothetical protein